ncbi:MAG TPA: DUF3653 domain-containing protein [Steroidobacteraceae bacterium]|nr:DUF3653 domain-containing protein [Steroidobacteraceae bacterium]
MSAQLIAELTGVSLKTAQRWKNQGFLPPTSTKLLELKLNQDLGELASAWAGFRIDKGLIWTPENASLTPGELRSVPYRREQLRALELALSQPRQFVLI